MFHGGNKTAKKAKKLLAYDQEITIKKQVFDYVEMIAPFHDWYAFAFVPNIICKFGCQFVKGFRFAIMRTSMYYHQLKNQQIIA